MNKGYNRKDYLYNQAKSEGYRSRAAYKLKELNQKFGVLKRGFKVLDLGAWPGGWLQVAAQAVGTDGRVVGIDLEAIDEFGESNVYTIVGDVRDEVNIEEAVELAGGKFDVVLSDMSPKLSGIKEVDRAGSVGCAELAMWVAEKLLRTGGNLIIKVFKSNEAEQFIRSIRHSFQKVTRQELDATRKTSNEFYVVALGFKSAQVG